MDAWTRWLGTVKKCPALGQALDTEEELINIEIQDTVNILYADTGETHTFIIIYGNAPDSAGKLNYQSPLARLLMQSPVNANGGNLKFIDREITITSVTKPSSDYWWES